MELVTIRRHLEKQQTEIVGLKEKLEQLFLHNKVCLERVAAKALETFGDPAAAAAWLTEELMELEGKRPLETLPEGEERVTALLNAIEHGICA